MTEIPKTIPIFFRNMFNNESMFIKHGTYACVSVRQCVSAGNEDLMRTENHKKEMWR